MRKKIVAILPFIVMPVLIPVSGALTFTFSYVFFEILVFAIEAIAYAALLKKFSSKEQKKGRAVGCAFVANAASFAFGLWLAHIIPGIF